MSEKIDARIPREVGEGALPGYPAVKTPWDRLITLHEAYHFIVKECAFMDAVFMQVSRILVPDYETRVNDMCEAVKNQYYRIASGPIGLNTVREHNVHPFMCGSFFGALGPDLGDEDALMCGRVNDFGTYRLEKELDVCYWDIVGSELCRTTVCGMQYNLIGMTQSSGQQGPNLDLHFTEARGCGDMHCRIVGENREKYPLPEHKVWETFGPVATEDQIKFTTEDELITESQMFREECGYMFRGPLCREKSVAEAYAKGVNMSLAKSMIWPPVAKRIASGELDEKYVKHVVRCLFEAAGKASFHDSYAIKGLRDWLGVPNDVNDGRVLGGYIEAICQMMKVPCEVEAFNKNEVIYKLDRKTLQRGFDLRADAFVWLWYGMAKTLVGAEWSVWEEADGAPEDILRLKIAKKVDKFC